MILRDIIHWGGVLKKKLEYEVVRRGYKITLEVLRQKKKFPQWQSCIFPL